MQKLEEKKAFITFGRLEGQNYFFLWIYETPFSKKVLAIFFICFILNSKIYKDMYNLRHKVRNGQNLPQGNFNNYFL